MTDRSAQESEYIQTLVPQPTIADGASWQVLPDIIVRKCCLYKSCGNTRLVKRLHTMATSNERGYTVIVGYDRESNGEPYAHLPGANVDDPESVAKLVRALNDPLYWPVP